MKAMSHSLSGGLKYHVTGIAVIPLILKGVQKWRVSWLTSILPASLTRDVKSELSLKLVTSTLGARDFSSAVYGFCQVFLVVSPPVASAYAEDVSAFGQHRKFPPHARKTSGTQGKWLVTHKITCIEFQIE